MRDFLALLILHLQLLCHFTSLHKIGFHQQIVCCQRRIQTPCCVQARAESPTGCIDSARALYGTDLGEGGETVRTVLPRWLQFPPGADYGLTRLTSAFSSSTKLNTTTGSGRDRPTMRIIRKRVPSADTSYCGV